MLGAAANRCGLSLGQTRLRLGERRRIAGPARCTATATSTGCTAEQKFQPHGHVCAASTADGDALEVDAQSLEFAEPLADDVRGAGHRTALMGIFHAFKAFWTSWSVLQMAGGLPLAESHS